MLGLRTLLFLAGIGLVIWILLRLSKTPRVRRKPTQQKIGTMVRCAYCGTHVPENEALRGGDGRSYCCREHLDRAG